MVAYAQTGQAANYFISPLGSNLNNGTSSATPWLTFAFAINSNRAWCGDTLFLDDGTYGDGTSTGKIDVNNVVCTLGDELTIAASNQRQAMIYDNGFGKAVWVRNSAYIILEGLYGRSVDDITVGSTASEAGLPMQVRTSHHITVRNGLWVNPNHYPNNAAMGFYYSRDGLFEGNEVYQFHRHCVTAFISENLVVRRQYCNPRGGKISGGFSQGGVPLGTGDAVLSMYPCKNCILENSIADGTETPLFLSEMNAKYSKPSGSSTQLPPPGQPAIPNVLLTGSKVLGSICYKCSSANGIFPNGRDVADTNHSPQDITIKDIAFVDQNSQSVAIKLQDVMTTIPGHVTVDHVSIFGIAPNILTTADKTGHHGIQFSDSTVGSSPTTNSATVQNVLVTGMVGNAAAPSSGRGFLVTSGAYNTWTIDHTISVGNAANYSPSTDPASATQTLSNTSSAPHGMGTCKMWVPVGAAGKGAGTNGTDIGANILYRYVNGVLTDEPLWDPITGEFPHGAIVTGVNDNPAISLSGFHLRVNVNTGGCPFPTGYGSGGGSGTQSTVILGNVADSGSGTTTLSWPMTISPNQNEALVCITGRDVAGNVGSVSAVDSSGESFDLVKRQVTSPGHRFAELWHRSFPTVGARTINVTTTGTITGLLGRSMEFDATDGLNTAVSIASPVGTPGSSISVTAPTNTNELVVDCVASSNAFTFTAGPDQTGQTNLSHGTTSLLLATSTQNGSDGGVMSGTIGGSAYVAQVAVSLTATPVDPPTTAVLEVSKFRIRRLLGTEADAEYFASNNVQADIGVDGAARVRVEITGSVATTSPFGVALYCRKNADALAVVEDVFNGKVFRLYGTDANTNIPASLTPTTQQLSSGSFVPGAVIRNQSAIFIVPALTVGQHVELEWALQLNASVGDVINCYPYKDDGTALDTLTVTPTINAVAASSQAGF